MWSYVGTMSLEGRPSSHLMLEALFSMRMFMQRKYRNSSWGSQLRARFVHASTKVATYNWSEIYLSRGNEPYNTRGMKLILFALAVKLCAWCSTVWWENATSRSTHCPLGSTSGTRLLCGGHLPILTEISTTSFTRSTVIISDQIRQQSILLQV